MAMWFHSLESTGAVVITHRYDLWGEVLEADETIPKRSPGWIPTDGLLYLLGLRTRVLNCEYDHVRSPKSSAHHLKNLQADPQRKRGDK